MKNENSNEDYLLAWSSAESDLKTNLQQHLQPRFTYLELLDNKEENKWINEQKAGICNDKHG